MELHIDENTPVVKRKERGGYWNMRGLYARFTREMLAGRDPRMKGTYDLREGISGLGWLAGCLTFT